uniref:Uncharacterized protein n=1 Tax=Davidia involucrata TaxID=16924 RepID=A0A5B7BXK4_DAVIN
MSSIFQSFHQKGSLDLPSTRTTKQEALPVSQPPAGGLRRRLSYLSLISSSPATATSWASSFGRSKSVSSNMGEYAAAGSSLVRKWWDWGWAWILSRKPTFARDLEMNEQETVLLGCHNKGSWRHVFYKVRSELTRLVGSDNVGLPQTIISFDDGKRRRTQGAQFNLNLKTKKASC